MEGNFLTLPLLQGSSVHTNHAFQQAFAQYQDVQAMMDKALAQQPNLEFENSAFFGLLETACSRSLDALHAVIDAHAARQAAAAYYQMLAEKASLLPPSQETQEDA